MAHWVRCRTVVSGYGTWQTINLDHVLRFETDEVGDTVYIVAYLPDDSFRVHDLTGGSEEEALAALDRLLATGVTG